MNFCPGCGVALAVPTIATETPVSASAGTWYFPLLLAAAAIPLGLVLLIVTVQPSVLSEPELYFVYALIEATAFLLLFRLFDIYEREPLSVLALMAAWGGTVALALAVIGNAALGRTLPRPVNAVFGAAITAPVIEESAKGAALLAAFLVSVWANRRFGLIKFDGLTDGLLYGAAVGLGFAFVEDLLYFLNSTYSHGVGSGLEIFATRTSLLKLNMLLHPLATGAFGAGLGLATWSRTRWGRYGFPALGLLVAMLTHAAWNGFDELVLVHRYGWQKTSAWFTTGVDSDLADRMQRTFTDADRLFHVFWYVFIALWAVTIALWLRHQRKVIATELGEEVRLGTLSTAELAQLLHVVARSRTDARLLLAGRFEERRLLRRLQSEFVDLAFFRHRHRDEAEAGPKLARRRRRIAAVRGELRLAASDVWVVA
jgi:RsiW-degrading membrane proteinase PrsW (M82 family)